MHRHKIRDFPFDALKAHVHAERLYGVEVHELRAHEFQDPRENLPDARIRPAPVYRGDIDSPDVHPVPAVAPQCAERIMEVGIGGEDLDLNAARILNLLSKILHNCGSAALSAQAVSDIGQKDGVFLFPAALRVRHEQRGKFRSERVK